MITVNAMGDACPIPVVKTKHAIAELNGAGSVEVFVDNEIAVQNLTKMANQKQYGVSSEKLEEGKYRVVMTVSENAAADSNGQNAGGNAADGNGQKASAQTSEAAETVSCIPDGRRDTLVVISTRYMGTGDEELGRILMKGFIYALTQQDELPSAILFYNSGAFLTSEESPELEDLKSLEAQGVEILTCGTCLNHYGLQDKLSVGSVTNMYTIVEKMTQAGRIVKP
jgi:selenium metabolism protein YedF